MPSTDHHRSERTWDGSFKHRHPQRRLRIPAASPSRLLRSGQTQPCAYCGNGIEWYHRPDGRPVPLHPDDLPAATIPAAQRWHINQGIAYAASDGTAWCRIPHRAICPSTPTPPDTRHLTALRRRLALTTRRLVDAGRFTPRLRPHALTQADLTTPTGRRRDIVQILHTLYLAPGPATALRCIAQTIARNRCPHRVDTHPDPTSRGRWTLIPVPTSPRGTRHLAEHLTGTPMAVHTLGHLPYAEHLRWRAQHCPAHATSTAADLTLAQWEPFDVFTHAEHITPALPGDKETRTCGDE